MIEGRFFFKSWKSENPSPASADIKFLEYPQFFRNNFKGFPSWFLEQNINNIPGDIPLLARGPG